MEMLSALIGLSVAPSSTVLSRFASVTWSLPLLTPPIRLTVSLSAQVARTPVWVKGTAPNRIEREILALLGLQITSVPCSVAYLPAIKVSGPPAYCAYAWVTSNIDEPAPVPSGKEWITWASLPTVTLTRPPNPSFGSLETLSPNWCSVKELFWLSNTRGATGGGGVPIPASTFLSACEYPASMYPFTLMPEASSTCPSVGALAAWASATVGAANAAETADAMRSFFIERPFVGGKNTSAAFYFGLKPARLLDAGSHRTFARSALPLLA